MTFKSSMFFINDDNYKDKVTLIQDMICAIVACREDLLQKTNERGAKEIEDALIMQLDNAMNANAELMSCVPGTPRFLRVVLETYLNIVSPQDQNHYRCGECLSYYS